MAKKSKSAMRDGFNQGFGSELGKKVAGIVFAIATVLALAIWGIVSHNSSVESVLPSINKSNSQPSNTR
jgi:hypothetical protein